MKAGICGFFKFAEQYGFAAAPTLLVRYCFSASSFLTILTTRLVPRRDAPSSMNFSASSSDEMPPAALIFTPGFTCFANSYTSWNVAPPVEKPVEVLM